MCLTILKLSSLIISRFTNGFSISRHETLTVNNSKLGRAIRVCILSAEKRSELSGSFTETLSAFIPVPNSGVVIILGFSKFIFNFAYSLVSF